MSGEQSEPAARVAELMERMASAFGVDATVEVTEDADGITGRFVGEDVGPLIGHHGESLDAIQHVAYRVAFQGGGERGRLMIDAAGYREQRAVALQAAADQAAEAAVREGQPVPLEAMSALERKLVHEHLKTRRDVETYSEGQEPRRHLVVAPLVT